MKIKSYDISPNSRGVGNPCFISDTEIKFSQQPRQSLGKVLSNPSENNEHHKGVSFEDILDQLGCFGPFQLLVIFTYLFMEIAASFVVFIPIFVSRSTEIVNNTRPRPPLNYSSWDNEFLNSSENLERDESYLSAIIGGFETKMMESPFEYETIVEEWDLKGNKAWIPDVFTSCLMAGMVAGNLFASQFADWYGRRKTYIAMLFFMLLGTIMSAFSPTIYFYAIARFIAGIGFCGSINASSMAVMEFMTPKWRSFANCVGPMGEGLMLLSLLAYLIRPWRLLYIATLLPYALIVPIYVFLPESPRWLLRNKKVKEAHDVLGYMAKINGCEPVGIEILEVLRKQEEEETESLKAKRMSYLDFIKNKSLLVTSIYLFAIWFAWNVSYYGISYNIRNVPGNQYINVVLIGLANAIGQRVSMPVSDCVGRRRAVLYGMTLSAIFLVTVAVCFLVYDEVNPYLILVACFVGLLGLACTRAAARLLSGESFPTAVRTMGLGMGGLGANVAGLLTPQVAYLGSTWPALPFFIFAVVSVLGSLVVFMMKETNGADLSDNLVSTKKENP